jgi:hypothetical protein
MQMNDPNPLIVGSRRWRVWLKSGEQRIVCADTLDPISSFGLAFSTRDVVVFGLAFGTYTEFEQIDPESNETPHVQVIAARDSTDAPQGQKRKTPQSLRRLPAASPSSLKDEAVTSLWACLPENGDWIALALAKSTFKAREGGFPVNAYRRFNEAVAAARANGLIEVFGDA